MDATEVPPVRGRSGARATETETDIGEGGVSSAPFPQPTTAPLATLNNDDYNYDSALAYNTIRRVTESTKPYNPPPPPVLQPPRDPNTLTRVSAITLLVEDLALTRRFYEHVFSVAAVQEDDNSAAFPFNDGTLFVNLYSSLDAGDRSLLGAGVQVGRERDAGRRVQLGVAVEDLDGVYARLRRLEEDNGGGSSGRGKGKEKALVVRGLTEPRLTGWGVWTIMFQDPSGHCWEVTREDM